MLFMSDLCPEATVFSETTHKLMMLNTIIDTFFLKNSVYYLYINDYVKYANMCDEQ